jgi:glycosyltransferase involved in cell wall biosynthesis
MAMLPPTEAVEREVASAGWQLTDPRPVSAGMDEYRDFIRGSRGEFTVAKDIYVRPNSGWFSDRSVCYLAAGRPVVTMRTGFTKFYPAGRGLFEYDSLEEVTAALEAIDRDYAAHSRAARRVAAEFFDSGAVIGRLMKDAGL